MKLIQKKKKVKKNFKINPVPYFLQVIRILKQKNLVQRLRLFLNKTQKKNLEVIEDYKILI